jgi:predicted ATPase
MAFPTASPPCFSNLHHHTGRYSLLITKVSLSGFRNVFKTQVTLGAITALVSLNNYGKSNFLRGLDFAQKFIKADSETRLRMMSQGESVPINTRTASEDFSFGMEFVPTDSTQYDSASYSFSFRWVRDDESGCRITNESLRLHSAATNRYADFIRRDSSGCYYKPSPTGRACKLLDVSSTELALSRLTADKGLHYHSVLRDISGVRFDFTEFVETEIACETFPIEPRVVRDEIHIDRRYGLNLPKAVWHLKQRHLDRYQRLLDSFKALIPSVESVEVVSQDLQPPEVQLADEAPVRLTDRVYFLIVKERYNNQYSSFRALSNGSRRMFMLLVSAVLSEINGASVIAFEEPEDCVHPQLFQRLLVILQELTNRCRIVLTSHSPHLIQYLSLDSVYFGVPNAHGVAEFRRIEGKAKQHQVMRNARELGVTMGDYVLNMLAESSVEGGECESDLFSYLGCKACER